MEFWLSEKHTEGYCVNWKFTKTLHTEQTVYQNLAVIDTLEFGKALVLDGIVQTTEKDEFVYHEMIAHPAMMAHPNPQRVLIVGGGDGGTLREVLRYKSVEQADLAEIDDRVILASKNYLPSISCGLNDKRVKIFVEDGIKFVATKKEYYDVIIVDSSDPVGPAIGLYSEEFYQSIYGALKSDGILVAQSESPLFYKDLLSAVNKRISGIFPITRTYLTSIATYIGGFWTFTVGSKKYDPLECIPEFKKINNAELNYYNEDIHKACFALPNFIKNLFK